MKLKIGVIMGGRSAEREVSLRTGEGIYNALKEKGYDAVKIDADISLAENVKGLNIKLAFLALHGRYGEDGTVQGLMELLEIPYTGPGVLASAIAMDKVTTKKILVFEGLPTPPFLLVDRQEAQQKGLDAVAKEILAKKNLPLVVKAPTQGSTIGITFVHQPEQLVPALEEAFNYDPRALVEEFVTGTEVTASILGNKEPVALPLIEIVSATGVYDYEAKYTVGMSDHIIPPRIPAEQQEKIKDLALKTYLALGCRGLSRVDFIITEAGEPYILEVNTLPGMTETSLFPDAARAAGIEFPDLAEKLVQLALEAAKE
jgi:D-alanine-D-alanine ligase